VSVTSLRIPQLGHSHQETLDQCLAQLSARSRRNRLRRRYYDHKNELRDLGISIPPSLRKVETVVGWPAKGVDALSRRMILDGFTIPGGSTEDLGLDALLEENRFEIEAPQAHTSALTHSVAFTSVTVGDVQAGEPEVLITMRDAESATGLWDGRRRALKAALLVFDFDESGIPKEFVLYVPNLAIIVKRTGSSWDVRQSAHELGIPVEALVYNPSLSRPFGRSRISRAVMALTDSAVRTLLRSEVSAEFFSAPQRYVLGADENSFVDRDGNPVPAWTSLLGRYLAIGRDEDGEVPVVGQFSQQSMQPHFEQLRAIAAMFAGEANLPLDSLGIVHDNPSSAEAIMRAKEELVMDAKFAIRTFGPSWQRMARSALMLRPSTPAERAQYAKIRAHWGNPATPSIVSASDAIVKQVSALPWMADSEVVLEELGYDQPTIARLMAAKNRAAAGDRLATLLQSPPTPAQGATASGEVVADGDAAAS